MRVFKAFDFSATIEIIGINPFVFVPNDILQEVFKQAGRSKGPIPIKGSINGKPYQQTLVKYSQEWRLYINASMLDDSPNRIGEHIDLSIKYDPESRVVKPPDDFISALRKNKDAKMVFDNLSASRRSEIVRYLANLKTEKALDRNIKRAINYLLGKESFVGRDRP